MLNERCIFTLTIVGYFHTNLLHSACTQRIKFNFCRKTAALSRWVFYYVSFFFFFANETDSLLNFVQEQNSADHMCTLK